jgi:hypothetical protein
MLVKVKQYGKAEKVLQQGLERVAGTEDKGRAVGSAPSSILHAELTFRRS